MRGHVKLLDGMRFAATTETDHELLLDSSMGEDPAQGPSPMELVLLSLGTCTGMDIVHILGQMHKPAQTLEVEYEAERAAESPRVFTRVQLHYRVGGTGLDEDVVMRAVDLSLAQYCSVALMLTRGGVEITTTFEVDKSEAAGP